VMLVDALIRKDLSEVTVKDIEDVVNSVIGNELAKNGITKMQNAQNGYALGMLDERLQYSWNTTADIIRMFGLPHSVTISNNVQVAFAGFLEYMTEEVLDLSGNEMKNEWSANQEIADGEVDKMQKIIIPQHVYLAVHEDKELNSIVIEWSKYFLYLSFESRGKLMHKDKEHPESKITEEAGGEQEVQEVQEVHAQQDEV
jgi:hypothetical protein